MRENIFKYINLKFKFIYLNLNEIDLNIIYLGQIKNYDN